MKNSSYQSIFDVDLAATGQRRRGFDGDQEQKVVAICRGRRVDELPPTRVISENMGLLAAGRRRGGTEKQKWGSYEESRGDHRISSIQPHSPILRVRKVSCFAGSVFDIGLMNTLSFNYKWEQSSRSTVYENERS